MSLSLVTQNQPEHQPEPPSASRVQPGGDEATLAALRPRLVQIALRYVHSVADAEDLVQEAFARGLDMGTRMRPDSNLKSWMATVIRNLAIDKHRRDRMRSRQEPLLSIVEDEDPPVGEPDSEIAVEDLSRALELCNADLRTVFELRHFRNLSYGEIARTLEIPRATVGTRLLRARSRLRSLLTVPERERAA